MSVRTVTGLVFFNIPEGPAAAYQRGCVMFFTMLLFELLPFCYVSFYSWDRKFFLADRESGIYATSAYYVAHMCASESRLTNPLACRFYVWLWGAFRHAWVPAADS